MSIINMVIGQTHDITNHILYISDVTWMDKFILSSTHRSNTSIGNSKVRRRIKSQEKYLIRGRPHSSFIRKKSARF